MLTDEELNDLSSTILHSCSVQVDNLVQSITEELIIARIPDINTDSDEFYDLVDKLKPYLANSIIEE
ncbi:hypothetical protein [Caudoviricetes sp.]|nr:hypothetical protein [Caudoviricetes sp.]